MLEETRVVHLHASEIEKNKLLKYPSNVVKTAKYSVLTFLPLNLFEQFHRLANVYFLILIGLNWIPQLQVFGKEVSMIPLVIVLSATACKDMYEDYGRHKMDKEVNNRSCFILENNSVVKKKWKELMVGDFVKIEKDQHIPADVVILATSFKDGNCFVSTMNLDGETNLKVKKKAYEQGFQSENSLSETWDQSFDLLRYEKPQQNIYTFSGFITRKSVDGSGEMNNIPLDNENLLLRGCLLKNTEWVIGVVIYTGHETKSMLNNKRVRAKRSQLEKDLNDIVLWLIILLIIMCLICGFGTAFWEVSNSEELMRLILGESRSVAALTGFLNFFSSIIVFQVIIPIAVYITIDIVNLVQVYFIDQDLYLYNSETQLSVKCRAFNVHSNLGQVRYIFSDKTGTLTCNRQEFHQCSIGGKRYNAFEVKEEDNEKAEDYSLFFQAVNDQLKTEQLEGDVDEEKIKYREMMHFFLLTMSICNTVTIERNINAPESSQTEYLSESPDETALVSAAAKSGYVLKYRSFEGIHLEIFGKVEEFRILALFPFSSDRKRMSIMIRSKSTQKIFLLTKGADETILLRLSKDVPYNLIHKTKKHLTKFSMKGLRTLCLAYRPISEEEYQTWIQEYNEISNCLEDREGKINHLHDTYEQNFSLLGATAVEDKLQDQVPETIEKLSEAGISIWVLTGDMQNTAINIAMSCRLLSNDMELFTICSNNEEECMASLKNAINKIEQDPKGDYVAVFHGQSLVHLLGSREDFQKSKSKSSKSNPKLTTNGVDQSPHEISPERKVMFWKLGRACKSVICCRVSPWQKARVVEVMRELLVNERRFTRRYGPLQWPNFSWIKLKFYPGGEEKFDYYYRDTELEVLQGCTLGIGDGANDVGMLQASDVGIGVVGSEGTQAIMASDYSLPQFSFLGPLLLTHGHWSYYRNSVFLSYSLYKNALLVLTLFMYQIIAGFSNQTPIDDFDLILYALLYTNFPVIIYAIFDKDIQRETLLSNTWLYRIGQENYLFRQKIFALTIVDMIYQAFMLTYIPVALYIVFSPALYDLGIPILTSCIFVATLVLCLETLNWTWIHHVAYWLSLILFFPVNAVFDSNPLSLNYRSTLAALNDPLFYLTCLVTVIAAILPRYVAKSYLQLFHPDLISLARQFERITEQKEVDRRPTETTPLLIQRLDSNIEEKKTKRKGKKGETVYDV